VPAPPPPPPQVAVKVVTQRDLPERERAALMTEMQIMLKLSHAHILRAVDFFQDEDKLYMVVELARGGELFERIVKKVGRVELAVCVRVCVCVGHQDAVA
jgi:calcium/calmodulin-dependent protein kinase I